MFILQSTENESVPLIVEVCTSIVEDKGLDIIGIYRYVVFIYLY